MLSHLEEKIIDNTYRSNKNKTKKICHDLRKKVTFLITLY